MSSGVSIFDINNNIRPVFMIGVGGNGMSALAFWCLGQNTIVWGSDRSQNGYSNAIDRLCKAGLVIKPQDGSGITEFFELYPNGIVLATPAVEKSVPDYIESCRYFGVPLMRSEFLAHVFNNSPIGIAVAGSAGKSSVSAMIFFELYANMMDPSFISGSPVIGFNNGIFGKGPMVIEADESDLSMVNYNYNALVLLNLTREHHEIDLMIDKMSDFLINSRDNSVVVANIDCPNVMEVIKIYKHRLSEKIHKLPNPALRPRVVTFSASGNTKADFYISACDLVSYFPWKTRITLNSITISADSNKSQHSAEIPLIPGFQIQNFLAVYALCSCLGLNYSQIFKGITAFPGLERRFQIEKIVDNIAVINDYAHAPLEIEAALITAKKLLKSKSNKILAVYQPHGFGPLRFTFEDLCTLFSNLDPQIQLWLTPVFYGGGTVKQDVDSEMLYKKAGALNKKNPCKYEKNMHILAKIIAQKAAHGDIILIMGARDINRLSGIIVKKLCENQ